MVCRSGQRLATDCHRSSRPQPRNTAAWLTRRSREQISLATAFLLQEYGSNAAAAAEERAQSSADGGFASRSEGWRTVAAIIYWLRAVGRPAYPPRRSRLFLISVRGIVLFALDSDCLFKSFDRQLE